MKPENRNVGTELCLEKAQKYDWHTTKMSWCYIKNQINTTSATKQWALWSFHWGTIPLLQEVGKYSRYPFYIKYNTAKILFQKVKCNPRFYWNAPCLLFFVLNEMKWSLRLKGNKAAVFILEFRPLMVDDNIFQESEE